MHIDSEWAENCPAFREYIENKYYTCTQYIKQSFSLVTNCKHRWKNLVDTYCLNLMMMLELQQSIFSIQVSAVCLHFVQTELRVFISCLLYFLLSGETKWLYILKQTQAANISSSGQKYFLSDLPSCWITGTEKHGVFTCRITKQNWNQIIPRISFTVHFEFSAQHTYKCSVKLICTSLSV